MHDCNDIYIHVLVSLSPGVLYRQSFMVSFLTAHIHITSLFSAITCFLFLHVPASMHASGNDILHAYINICT